MALYRIFITPTARRQLQEYVEYIQWTLLNAGAAEALLTDALEVTKELSFNAKSIDFSQRRYLSSLCCREIPFRRHDYVMIYRVKGAEVYIDAVYHRQQLPVQRMVSGAETKYVQKQI